MISRSIVKTFAAIGVLVAGLGNAVAQEKLPVNIGVGSTSFANAAGLLARELGLYDKHGLVPTITVAENASVATAALIAGSFDVAFVGAGELITSQGRGIDLVAIASLYGGSSGTLVLSAKAAEKLKLSASDPAEARLKALDGLTIATPSKVSSFTYAFVSAANNAGAEPVMTYLSQGAMSAALQTGAIDGFIASAPYWVAPIEAGFGVAWLKGTLGELGASNTLSSASMAQMLRTKAESKIEVAKRLKFALDETAELVRTKPDTIKAALLKIYPSLTPKALDIIFESESLGWMKNKVTNDDIARDIVLVKATVDLPLIDKIDSTKLVFFQN